MTKLRNYLAIIFVSSIFRIISFLIPITYNTKGLIRLKIYFGTMLLGLYSAQANAQHESKNDTIVINVSLEKQNDDVIETPHLMCYLAGNVKQNIQTLNYEVDLERMAPLKAEVKMQYMTDAEFRTYLSSKLRYPDEAYTKRIEGIVQLSYMVDNKGRISQIKVLKSLGYGCDEEALRLLNLISDNGIIIKERNSPASTLAIRDSNKISFECKSIFIEFKLR